MAAIKRALLPPILKTVKLTTLSALGKACRISANELKSVRLTIRCQDSSAVEQSGCLLVNSSKRFRVMMCIRGYYRIMRCLSIKKIMRRLSPVALEPLVWSFRSRIKCGINSGFRRGDNRGVFKYRLYHSSSHSLCFRVILDGIKGNGFLYL